MEHDTSDQRRDDPTATAEHLDTLEEELEAVDPSDAPLIAEQLATQLGDALEATQESSRVEGDGP